jgi:hypothetical protein
LVELTALWVGYFLVTVVCLALYLLPTFVAFSRQATHRYMVLALNFFLGATVVGWVIALALAVSEESGPARIV